MDYGDAFPVYFEYNEMYDGFANSFLLKEQDQVSEQDGQATSLSGGEVEDKGTNEMIDINTLKEYISKLDSIYPAENPELVNARLLLLRYYHALQVYHWMFIFQKYYSISIIIYRKIKPHWN